MYAFTISFFFSCGKWQRQVSWLKAVLINCCRIFHTNYQCKYVLTSDLFVWQKRKSFPSLFAGSFTYLTACLCLRMYKINFLWISSEKVSIIRERIERNHQIRDLIITIIIIRERMGGLSNYSLKLKTTKYVF